MATSEEVLQTRIMSYWDDPIGFAMFAFPWGERGSPLEKHKGPRGWQKGVLKEMRLWLQSGKSWDEVFRFAMKSGHGPGKSALIAIVVLWAMSTRRDCRVVVTANTEGQLQKKTWPELAKWHRMAINSHWFRYTATSLVIADETAEKNWRADAIPWSETNPEAFAGLHNEGNRLVVVFDEASAIPDKIWEVTEGALTDENTQIMWMVFGNPTRNAGSFRGCFGRFRHLWRRLTVDTRDVEGVNQSQIREWIKSYGLDSDFVRVRVLGKFPKGSSLQFIGEGLAERAMKRDLPKKEYEFAPVIIGVDPAWTGEDTMEIVARQGMKCWGLESFPRNDDDVQVANLISMHANDLDAEAIFVDGGFGTGIHSILKAQGQPSQLVWFGEKPIDPQYMNKRVEMWGQMKDWLKEGGDVPDEDDWMTDLCSVQDKPDALSGRSRLETKEEMRKRGEASPGKGDALALTFAMPIHSRKALRACGDYEMETEWEDW